MKQLTLGVIMGVINDLKNSGMSLKEIKDMQVYIGNDDELNGIHTAWYVNILDQNEKDDKDFVEMINEDHHNIAMKGKSILIS